MDIDKAYMLGASISDQGLYYNWSPLFNFNSSELFNISHQLPFPNDKHYFLKQGGMILNGNYDELLNKTYQEISNDPYLYKQLVSLLKEVDTYNGSNIYIDGLNDDLIQIINKHNQYKLRETDYRESIKNKIFNLIWNIGDDVRNIVSSTSPITMGPARDAADTSTSGKFSNLLSLNNPAAKLILQYQNSIGKDGIGVYATGIKVFSLLLNYYNEKLKVANSDTLTKYTFNEDPIKAYDNDGNEFNLTGSPTLPNVKINPIENPELTDLLIKLRKFGLQEDVFLSYSVLLSAATDNAKELILEKINAGPDLASVYLYLLASGVKFDSVTKLMTTKAVSLINKKSQKNILYLNGKTNNLKGAVSYYTDYVNPDWFIEQKYQQSILNWGDSIVKKLIKTGFEVGELNEISKYNIFKLLNNASPKVIDEIERQAFSNGDNKLKVYKSEYNKNSRTNYDDSLDFLDTSDINEEMYSDFEQDSSGEMFSDYNKNEDLRYLFSRYISEVRNRNSELKVLKNEDLKNMKLVLDLKTKSEEMTILGALGSLNQGIKTKLIDRIRYSNKIEKFINNQFKKYNMDNKLSNEDPNYLNTDFKLYDFITDDIKHEEFINAYEKAKNKFNILDIISSVPHFSEMLKAYAVNDKILNTFTIKNELADNLSKQLIDNKAITQLLPNTMGEINRFINDAIIMKFLKEELNESISLPIGSTIYDSLGKKSKVSVIEKPIDFSNVFDRASFKIWFENDFIKEMKNTYPNNKFIQGLTRTFYDKEFGIEHLYKLPIDMSNLEEESNNIAFSNYLNAFDAIKNNSISNSNLDLGDMFFLYNLLVNKNSFGGDSLTKIFENSIDSSNENSLPIRFMNFEAQLNPNNGGTGLIRGKDYNLNDLIIRTIAYNEPNGTSFSKSKSGNELIIKNNDEVLDIFSDNNTMIMPYLTKGFTKFNYLNKQQLISKLVNLISTNKAEIKLKCDE